MTGKAEVVELEDGGDAEFEESPRELAGGFGVDGRVGVVAADQEIVELLAEREHLVLDIENEVLHPPVGFLEDAADGVALAGPRGALDHDAGADQPVGKRDVLHDLLRRRFRRRAHGRRSPNEYMITSFIIY